MYMIFRIKTKNCVAIIKNPPKKKNMLIFLIGIDISYMLSTIYYRKINNNNISKI